MLRIVLEPRSHTPVYRQIVEQIRTLVSSGELDVGTTLPTVRQLGAELGVSRLTVHRAYQELQRLGIVSSRTRRGTVVAPIFEEDVGLERLKTFTKTGPFSDFERISERTNVRSLASPVPDARLFDADQYLACANVLRNKKEWPFYYPDDVSDARLAKAFAPFARQYGLDFDPESLVTLGGLQPGFPAVLGTLAQEGDTVAIQEPHSLGSARLYAMFGYEAVGVPTGSEGLDTDRLRAVCKQSRPVALVAQPNFGFSDGIRWTEDNRREVARVLQHYGVRLFERTGLSVLCFDEVRPQTVFGLLPDDLGFADFSFQTSVAAGINFSFAHARGPYRSAIIRTMVKCGLYLQRPDGLVAHELLRSGSLQSNLQRIVREYRVRRDALCETLASELPEGCTFRVPHGGYCLYVRLPKSIDSEALFDKALDRRVAVMPGRFVCTAGSGDDGVALSYSMLAPPALQEAGSIFCRLLKTLL